MERLSLYQRTGRDCRGEARQITSCQHENAAPAAVPAMGQEPLDRLYREPPIGNAPSYPPHPIRCAVPESDRLFEVANVPWIVLCHHKDMLVGRANMFADIRVCVIIAIRSAVRRRGKPSGRP